MKTKHTIRCASHLKTELPERKSIIYHEAKTLRTYTHFSKHVYKAFETMGLKWYFENPSKTQAEHYYDLLEERKDHPCTPEQQAGQAR